MIDKVIERQNNNKIFIIALPIKIIKTYNNAKLAYRIQSFKNMQVSILANSREQELVTFPCLQEPIIPRMSKEEETVHRLILQYCFQFSEGLHGILDEVWTLKLIVMDLNPSPDTYELCDLDKIT